LEVAVVDPKGAKSGPDGAAVNTENIINVSMEDLSDKDWNKLEHELQQEIEQEMEDRQRKNLSCFQKTHLLP
jgi:hypothetical protein